MERQFVEQPGKWFSWWDYRAARFDRDAELCIDPNFSREVLSSACKSCQIDRQPHAWERPSDRSPVVANFPS